MTVTYDLCNGLIYEAFIHFPSMSPSERTRLVGFRVGSPIELCLFFSRSLSKYAWLTLDSSWLLQHGQVMSLNQMLLYEFTNHIQYKYLVPSTGEWSHNRLWDR